MVRTQAMGKKGQLRNIIGPIPSLAIELRKGKSAKQAEGSTAQ